MADPRLRELKIKSGVVKRCAKEKTVCEKEVGIERNRLEKFRSQGADSHVLKKQEEVIQECLMMLPDSTRRLKKEYEALEKLLNDEQELKETKEYELATEILKEAKIIMSQTN